MTITSEVTRDLAKKCLKENMNIIRKNIRSLMLEKKLLDEDLAYLIKSNRSYINYLLNRKGANTSIDTLGKIAEALDVRLVDLLR